MRLPLLVCILTLSTALAGQSLVRGRQSSYATHIYKLTNQQAGKLYGNLWALDTTYLTTLHDAFPSDSIYRKVLPVGHYLFIKTIKSNLQCELVSVNNLDMKILNNHRDLQLVFSDSLGALPTTVDVRVRSRKIPYSAHVQAYRLPTTNVRGTVSAAHQGHVSYFSLERRYNNTFVVRSGKKLLNSLPVRYALSPVTYLYKVVRSTIFWRGRPPAPGIYNAIRKLVSPTLTGYMVLNKPLYKPGDTVQMKAYITTLKGRPVSRPGDVALTTYRYASQDKKLGKPHEYRKGAYTFSFVLHDSLQLTLDQLYYLQLRNKKGRELMYADFRLEEYELKQNTYSVRVDNVQKYKPGTLYLKAEDSNGMPLYDIRASVVLKTNTKTNYYRPRMFIPDTLWRYETKLEALGETKVTIPDSAMVEADFTYEAVVSFLNTENERIVETRTLTYNARPFPALVELIHDSLVVRSLDPARPVTQHLLLTSETEDDVLTEREITVPYREKVNYFASEYSVRLVHEGQHRYKVLDVTQESDHVQVMASRTRDSLLIVTNNPRKVVLRYFLFKNKRLVASGHATNLSVKRKASPSDNYSLSVQYVWAGASEERDYQIPYNTRSLNIEVVHPDVVYPGARARIDVSVTDAGGEPVANADLTAFAITRKFQNQSPSLPSFSKKVKSRAVFNEFTAQDAEETVRKRMQWSYWKKNMGLDSIVFYRFLFPGNGYFEHRVSADTAQVAPFVVGFGEVIPVEVLSIDNQPVYVRSVNQYEPYSFSVKAGTHTLALRVRNQLITLNVVVREREKLILSIDRTHLPPACTSVEMPYRFTDEELKRLSRYFIGVRWRPGDRQAYLRQGTTVRALQSEQYSYSRSSLLIGPFYPGPITYVQKDGFQKTVTYEPFHSYEFKEGALTLRSLNVEEELKNWYFPWSAFTPSFADAPETQADVETRWRRESASQQLFDQFPEYEPLGNAGQLTFDRLPADSLKIRVKATFLIDLFVPDTYFVVAKPMQKKPLPAGRYQAVLLLHDQRYLLVDSIEVKANGENYYDLSEEVIHEADSFSVEVLKTIATWSAQQVYMTVERQREAQRIRELYYREMSAGYTVGSTIRGRVLSSEDNSPLPGVNVVVKGTTIGTVTDLDGYYELNCPSGAELVFSFIGLQTQEVAIGSRSQVDMALTADVTQLSEVVVMGAGIVRKPQKLVSSTTQLLAGKVAGVQIGDYKALQDSVAMQIRGYSTMTANAEPLVVLDGVVVRMSDVDHNKITLMEVLRGPEATALYGARAANGVLLLSTNPGATRAQLQQQGKSALTIVIPEETPGNALRKNFRDYAFWKPTLRTNIDGKASFEATFPDDITGWRTTVLGVAGKKTGMAQSEIRSYKPLIAQLAQPHFLIDGDSTHALGKITNYTPDSIVLERTVAINDRTVNASTLHVKNSAIDTIAIKATGTDSVAVLYSVSYNKYTDGELRHLPVYAAGTQESVGSFVAMPRDTSFSLEFDASKGPVTVFAQADLRNVLLDEIRYLKTYEYECNEQLASRLRALLLERTVASFTDDKPRNEAEIRRVVRKLVRNQNNDGSWSWWDTGGGNSWITLHVARSIDLAQRHGVTAPIDTQSLINYLESTLSDQGESMRLEMMAYLQEKGEKLPIQELTDSIRQSATASLRQKLMAQRLRQLAGLPCDWAWILSQKSGTVKGNWYWGEEKQHIQDNSTFNTLLVHTMMANENATDLRLSKLQNYFLETRKQHWRNTYESSSILEALVPHLPKDRAGAKPTLTLVATTSEPIVEFPFEKKYSTLPTLRISKSGAAPIYLTAYQQVWNKSPEAAGDDFTVTSSFDNGPKELRTGTPATLTVRVDVKRDAEYVQVEVPIPAGCSYASKLKSRSNGEVHREYYYHKTIVYCQSLKKGTYEYRIELLPRYTGSYTLNPAVAQSMYFPTIYGREGMKKVIVK